MAFSKEQLTIGFKAKHVTNDNNNTFYVHVLWVENIRINFPRTCELSTSMAPVLFTTTSEIGLRFYYILNFQIFPTD